MVVGLSVLGLWFAALEAIGADVSRGRQIILSRGLQIQAMTLPLQGTDRGVYSGGGSLRVNQWLQANFTTINLWQSPDRYNQPILARLPAGTPDG